MRAIVALAQQLGLRVVAEGVETNDELVLLRRLDCDLAQGYLFAKPKRVEACDLFLRESAAVLLATEPAGFGAGVTMIDADPNKPLSHWSKRAGRPENLSVVAEVAEDSIIDAIESAAAKTNL